MKLIIQVTNLPLSPSHAITRHQTQPHKQYRRHNEAHLAAIPGKLNTEDIKKERKKKHKKKTSLYTKPKNNITFIKLTKDVKREATHSQPLTKAYSIFSARGHHYNLGRHNENKYSCCLDGAGGRNSNIARQ